MSQCHDDYAGVPGAPTVVPETAGTQCHDLPDPPAMDHGHDCTVVSEHRGEVQVVRVRGRLDWTTCDRFREALLEVNGDTVVIDLCGARTDASGTGALLTATAHAGSRHQQLVFVVDDPLEHAVLTSTGLASVAPMVRTEEEALEWAATVGGR